MEDKVRLDRNQVKDILNTINRKDKREAKKFINRLGKDIYFNTGSGRGNIVVDKDSKYIYIKSLAGKNVVPVEISKISNMVAFFNRIRIVERKELEVFSNYNSMMFGLLALLFKNISKINKIKNILRLYLIGVRVFFAGGERSKRDIEIISQSGGRFVLYSYFWVRKGKAWKEHLKKNNLRCLLDCGKFSEWMAKRNGKKVASLNIDEYIKFIKENIEYLEGYFVFDEIGNHEKTMENFRYMQSKGLNPIPVFHMGTSMQELDKLVEEGCPLIGLGGTVDKKGVTEFLDAIFEKYPNTAFHGLGITKAKYILNYPFFSCDSKSWIYCRMKNKLLTPVGQVVVKDRDWRELLKDSVEFLTSLENVFHYNSLVKTI